MFQSYNKVNDIAIKHILLTYNFVTVQESRSGYYWLKNELLLQ